MENILGYIVGKYEVQKEKLDKTHIEGEGVYLSNKSEKKMRDHFAEGAA